MDVHGSRLRTSAVFSPTMALHPSPPLRGGPLRVLVTAAESPGSGALVFAIMTRTMGIAELLAVPVDDEPAPIDERPVPFAGRGGGK